jgi:hypothetical protein
MTHGRMQTNIGAVENRNRPLIKNYKIQTIYKKTKGSHGLHKSSFKLQTMTALIKSFCRGVQGGQFFQKAPPLAAGG